MGLDISPGGAQWSYSGFMEFRRGLAAEEGLVLGEMEGFCQHYPGDENAHPGAPCPVARRPWSEADTPLEPLLSHSDCDGVLLPYQCEQMLPRLREIHYSWLVHVDYPVMDYDVRQLGALIDGMAHCVQNGCAVVFR